MTEIGWGFFFFVLWSIRPSKGLILVADWVLNLRRCAKDSSMYAWDVPRVLSAEGLSGAKSQASCGTAYLSSLEQTSYWGTGGSALLTVPLTGFRAPNRSQERALTRSICAYLSGMLNCSWKLPKNGQLPLFHPSSMTTEGAISPDSVAFGLIPQRTPASGWVSSPALPLISAGCG